MGLLGFPARGLALNYTVVEPPKILWWRNLPKTFDFEKIKSSHQPCELHAPKILAWETRRRLIFDTQVKKACGRIVQVLLLYLIFLGQRRIEKWKLFWPHNMQLLQWQFVWRRTMWKWKFLAPPCGFGSESEILYHHHVDLAAKVKVLYDNHVAPPAGAPPPPSTPSPPPNCCWGAHAGRLLNLLCTGM